jgi:hypothetical protein
MEIGDTTSARVCGLRDKTKAWPSRQRFRISLKRHASSTLRPFACYHLGQMTAETDRSQPEDINCESQQRDSRAADLLNQCEYTSLHRLSRNAMDSGAAAL